MAGGDEGSGRPVRFGSGMRMGMEQRATHSMHSERRTREVDPAGGNQARRVEITASCHASLRIRC